MVALALTVLLALALALIALEASGAPVLAAVVGALLVAILVARGLALAGWKVVLAFWGSIAAVVALAFAVAQST